MKKLGITQRVEVHEAYDERRDCLDQRWSGFALSLGALPLPLPNTSAHKAKIFVEIMGLDAIFLSGGNSLAAFEKDSNHIATERDEFEFALIHAARENDIPIIGFCRGMQILNVFFGGKINEVEGHVGSQHHIHPVNSTEIFPKRVNSFHTWGISQNNLSPELEPLALDDCGNIEAFQSKKMKILGLMWHPERDYPFDRLCEKLILQSLAW